MRVGRVDTMERWAEVEAYLVKHGYKRWQSQYDIDSPEGYRATFSADNMPGIKIITYDADVKAALMRYWNSQKW